MKFNTCRFGVKVSKLIHKALFDFPEFIRQVYLYKQLAISKGNPCGLPDWENRDMIFKTEYKFYNTKGDLRGGEPAELFKLLPTMKKNKFKETKL